MVDRETILLKLSN